jgi:multiple sugar transport system substrate-binding protein
MRRPRLTGLILMTLMAVVAGCAEVPGNESWPPSASATRPATITVLSGTDSSISPGNSPLGGATGLYSELVNWWNANEEPLTGITVRLDMIDGGATQEHSEMLAAAQAGDSSYDIYNLDSEWISEFAAGGYIRFLGNRLPVNGYLSQPLTSGKDASERLYAAPFTTDVGLLYYRSDLVPDADNLSTFDQVLKKARQVQGSHPSMNVGYAGQFAKYEGLTVNLLEIIRGEAPDSIDKDGAITDPSAVTGILQQLIDNIGQGNPISSSEIRGYTEAQAYQAFAEGQAVFMRNWPIYYNQLTAPQSGSTTAARHFGVAPLPFPSTLGGQDLAISNSSADPADAMKVVEFLTSPQAERCLFAVGGFPATRSSAYQDNSELPVSYQVAGKPLVTGRPLCGSTTGRQLSIGKEILQGIARSVPRPVTPYYTELSTLVQDQVWPLLSKASLGASYNVSLTVSDLSSDIQSALTGHVASS